MNKIIRGPISNCMILLCSCLAGTANAAPDYDNFVDTYPYKIKNTDAIWTSVNAQSIPANAIIYRYVGGNPIYYCRVKDGGEFNYGELVPQEGCYLDNDDAEPRDSYEVLVR